MPSSFSTNLRFEKQANGENDTTWGTKMNTVIDLIEAAISGRAAVTHDDTANYTLTTANGSADEARNMILNVGGALTAARNLVVPTVSKLYVVKNATTNGYAITVKTTAGTGIIVPNGKTKLLMCDGTNVVNANWSDAGLFRKGDPTTAAFVKTGAFTISTQAAEINIEVNGSSYSIAASTAVTMPGSPAAGTDYAIWAKTDGTLEATSNHVTPPTANARKIGGFHYAPGGNATGVAGGDATPAINAYSIWDLKFRPACLDPRGMTLVADSFWADIYLLGVDHPTNGSSKYNVTIADGSSPPKIPAAFGGNGSTAYGGGNWWDMGETLHSFGKRHPTYDEFTALAYGVLEANSLESDPGTTGLVNGTGGGGAGLDHNAYKYTSKWGVIQATGNMYVWGMNFGGPYGTAAWTANTGGRGSTYELSNAVLLGGDWFSAAHAGSRCSLWDYAPASSTISIGARGVCDHLQLD